MPGNGSASVLPAGERAEHAALGVRGAQRVVQIGLQHRVRPDLDKDAETVADQPGHALGEPHRAADVAPPVRGIEFAGATGSPVTVETSAVSGAVEVRPARSASRSSRIGSIAAEWNAKSRSRARNAMPRRRASAPSRSIASSGPESVTDWLALSAPISSGLPISASSSRAASAPSASAAMRPWPRVRSCCRLRATTTRAASSSDSAPAAQAAPISPTLWPICACASIPSPRSTVTMPTCTANSSGCAMSACANCSASAPRSSHLADRPAERRAQGRVRVADRVAERGARPVGVAPHAGHCAPLPANTKASFASRTAVPVTTAGAFDPGGEIGERGDGVGPVGAERDEALRMVLAPARGAAQQRADRFGRRRGERVAPALRKRRAARPRCGPR